MESSRPGTHSSLTNNLLQITDVGSGVIRLVNADPMSYVLPRIQRNHQNPQSVGITATSRIQMCCGCCQQKRTMFASSDGSMKVGLPSIWQYSSKLIPIF